MYIQIKEILKYIYPLLICKQKSISLICANILYSSSTVCVYHTACVSYGLETPKNVCIDWFMKNLLVTQDICYIRDIR